MKINEIYSASLCFSMIPFVRIVVILIFVVRYYSICEKSYEIFNKKCFRVTALVPARAGSKGIKDKNLSIIKNETLLAKTLRAITKSDRFSSIWVSTDGKLIAQEAAQCGAKVHWRDPSTATDNSSTLSVVEDFLKSHRGIYHRGYLECDILAVVQCTSPFIQANFLSEAYDEMIKSDADCIFSVTRSHQLRWTKHDDGFAFPLNFKPNKRPRRQDWQGELVENGMFYFAKKNLILKQKVLQNNRCKTFEIPKEFSLEIDTSFDLTLARIIASIFKENNTLT